MAYVKILYQDSPSTATPLNAQNLNHMDDGIAENDRRLNELSTAGVVNTFNSRTGNVTSEKGDYDINQIVVSDGQDGYIPVWRNSGTEQEPDWGFEMEEMGGSGHEIIDSEGNTMPQEDAMQFLDSFLTDDSVNGRTKVENIKAVTQAQYPSQTEDGIYIKTDTGDAVLKKGGTDYPIISQTAGNITYDNTQSGLSATKVQGAIDEVASEKVNKSGDTMSGSLQVNRPNGTTTTNGSSSFIVGNNIPIGTEGNSRGYVDIYGTSEYFARFRAGALTENRVFDLPNKTGTVALTSDLSNVSEVINVNATTDQYGQTNITASIPVVSGSTFVLSASNKFVDIVAIYGSVLTIRYKNINDGSVVANTPIVDKVMLIISA